MSSIWWIRRDLRLADNLTLQKALEYPPILPVFILDPLLSKNVSDRRLNFLYQNLNSLDLELQKRGSGLVIRTGKPVEVLETLLRESGAERIFAEEDFTPYARLRSVLVGSYLPLKLVQGQLGIHPLDALKTSGKPYRRFTSFKRNWLETNPAVDTIPVPDSVPSISDIVTDGLPIEEEELLFPPGEENAHHRLGVFLRKKIEFYHLSRDRMDLDASSNLGPYIRFGVLGLRSVYHQGLNMLYDDKNRKDLHGVDTWLSDLIWREFYIHILYHFPESRTQNFRSMYDQLPWRNDESEFQAWKDGQTGYPVVDAAMRQLNQTGWIPNQARIIAASFLIKNLLIDWRWGEKWFRECLFDGDLAVNNGNWQWVAGTGPDAAPFEKILSPIRQSRKYDPTGNYLRKWIPELAHLDKDSIYAPWEKKIKVPDYPGPIVDHKISRERALIAYRTAKGV